MYTYLYTYINVYILIYIYTCIDMRTELTHRKKLNIDEDPNVAMLHY